MSLKDVPTGKRLRYLRLMLTQLWTSDKAGCS